jgi:hypothetical protein
MGNTAGFRTIVVHGDQSVDTRIMRDMVEHRRDDFLAFYRLSHRICKQAETIPARAHHTYLMVLLTQYSG